MVLLLLDLPRDVFDIIIAFVAADGFLECRHTTTYDRDCSGTLFAEHANVATRCLPLRLVHSSFRRAIDPHLFRVYCEDLTLPADCRCNRVSQLFAKSHIRSHVRALNLFVDERQPWESEQSRVLKVVYRVEDLLQDISNRVKSISFDSLAHKANHWYQLRIHSFIQLREFHIHDATFAFCLPKIAWAGPQLQKVCLEGYGMDPNLTFDKTCRMVEASGVLSDIEPCPLRPIEQLSITYLGAAWLNYFLSVTKPKFMQVLFVSEEAGWSLPLPDRLEGIGYLENWSGLRSFEITEVGDVLEDRATWSNEILQKRNDLFESLKEAWKGRGIRMSMDMHPKAAKTRENKRKYEKVTIYS